MATSIEPMLKAHVLPDLASSHLLLRSRACWVYGEFSDFDIEETQHVQLAVDGIYQGLFSECLPLRFASSLALAKMLNNVTAMNFLKPFLSSVLQVYLKIMDEIDSEELIGALEVIMEKFQDDIGPFAVQLATQLTIKYKALVADDNNGDDDDEEERQLAAAGCVTAIRRIIEALNKDKAGLT